MNTPLPTASHEIMRQRLVEYAHAVALGAPLDAALQVVADHVETCASCRAELFDALDASYALYSNSLSLVDNIPAPSLKFLRQHSLITSAAPETVGYRFMIEFSDEMLKHMQIQLQYTGQMRGQRLIGTYRQSSVSIPDVTIEMYESMQPKHAVLHCYIQVPERDPFDQAGTQVMVVSPTYENNGTTDADGFVLFDRIPIEELARLKIKILN
ncbi:MAG TPA: hypothetical protein DEF47_00405 [Herpetosiphon sp.]|uniref:Zinc-finger domain-containing protein n=2 Tax=Herpetosiphon TaxID=64 RepID=A9B4L1_HERA2|nr:hypothetical protein Haur_1532 [Herpetosiphon aurantiacus DSM 785]MCA0353010.1 hypothetical protein [Chloroflexota bacterium]HBW48349.1 hypothetical protein [Herpetosiphon sp.]